MNHGSHGATDLGFCRPVDTPDGPPTTLHSPFSFLVSLSVSLVLCDTAAGGVEAAVLARLHHVALPLWAVTSRLRACAAAVEAAVVAAVVAAGGAAVAVTDEVLRAAVVGAAAVSIAVVCLLRRRWLRWRLLLLLPLLLRRRQRLRCLSLLALAAGTAKKGSCCGGRSGGTRRLRLAVVSWALARPLSPPGSAGCGRGPGCRTWRSTTPCPPRALASSRLPSACRSRSRRRSVLQAYPWRTSTSARPLAGLQRPTPVYKFKANNTHT